jgi:hypothetical protein
LDSKGFKCRKIACPHCHLEIPRPTLEMSQRFVSIVGAPASGKSYFLAAMSWKMRSVLSESFCMSFSDADSEFNRRIHEYESMQFMNPNPNAFVSIEKTEEQGDQYNTVLIDGQDVTYPQPYIFSLTPQPSHPNAQRTQTISRSLCLYDNAGESFLPGKDSAATPLTQHLAHSDYILFLFDPTQDPRFRQACAKLTNDPQMTDRNSRLARESDVRQDVIFTEMANRIRQHAGIGSTDQHNVPLIVVVTKFDSWRPLLRNVAIQSPIVQARSSELSSLNISEVKKISGQLRKLMHQYCPEIVNNAESFASDITYIPVSATGCSPTWSEEINELGFRARDIKPIWAEVPLLYALAKKTRGIIPISGNI